MRFYSFVAAAALLSASLAAHADTITLDAATSSNGTYNYTYFSNNGSVFSGSPFTFTGLSGVTGASTQVPGFFTVSFTSTSVSFDTASGNGAQGATFTDLFSITSSVLTLGTVQYSIPTTPAQTGTTLGPVAAVAVTPEPSSLALLGTGILGVAGVIRKRLA